jgi:hypothetical protein
MRKRKDRLTVTVDRALVHAGNRAVAAGRAESLSGWVNHALVEWAVKERRLQSMAEAIAAYESEFGAISPMELAAQERADQRSAIVVRGRSHAPRRRRRAGA